MAAAIREVLPSLDKDDFTDVAVSYVAAICCTVVNLKMTADEDWAEAEKYFNQLSKNIPSGAFSSLREKCAAMVTEEVEDDDEDAEDLCNCQFTLAYGEMCFASRAPSL